MIAVFSCFASGGSLWEKISGWYQNSLLRELINYISEQYFTMELGTYDNFAISGTSGATLRNMILAVAAGIILASLMTLYNRRGLGGFVRRLIAEKADSPENAKTLMELGYFRSTMIRRELARGTALRMVVRSPEKEAFENRETKTPKKGIEPAYKHDFMTARFYIPEDLRARAEVRFDLKGSGWLPTLITIAVTVVAASLMCWFLPDLIQFADNIISFFSP